MTKTEIQKIRDYRVVKSNSFIQKVRHQLSAQEQKIILYLISKLKPEDEKFTEYVFEISEFCKVCGIDCESGKNFSDIRSAVKKLADKSFWVRLDDVSQSLCRWISKARFFLNSGMITIQLDDLKRKVLDVALREINTVSDLEVTYEPIKEGRKYTKIKFAIRLRTDIRERLKVMGNIEKIIG